MTLTMIPAPTVHVSVIVEHPTSLRSHPPEPGWDVIHIVGWMLTVLQAFGRQCFRLDDGLYLARSAGSWLGQKQSLSVMIRATPTSHSPWALDQTDCELCIGKRQAILLHILTKAK